MASQQSSGSGSSSLCRGSYPQLYCFHNEVALLRVVRHVGPHQGKRFYGCSYWPDEIDDIREMQHLMFEKDVKFAELELHKSELEMNRKRLKDRKSKLDDQVAQLGIEERLELQCTRACRKLALAFVLSW
ncbi:Lon protease-like protein mitochondrial, partial [Bienertia sinuspersici]